VGLFRKTKTTDDETLLLDQAIATHAKSARIDTLEPRQLIEVVGRVEHVASVELDGTVAFEIEVNDGTGAIVALWTGRRSIACVERGRRIALWGRAAPMRREHSLVVYNPRYELLP
jgi:N-acetylglucosamine kinase-like BadF-type ATPase